MKVKKYLILMVLVSLFSIPIFFLTPVKGDDATLVDSEITQNSYLRMEMYLYKRDDSDPTYDYYLIELNFFEVWYDGNIWRNVWHLNTYIYCWTSDSVIQLTYREPDPGWQYSPTSATVDFFGFSVPITIGAGQTTYEYSDSMSHWTTDAINGGWGLYPAIRDGEHADYTIGFRVDDGDTLSAYADTYAKWYKFNFIRWSYLGGGGIYGSVYYTP
jgi:hypothetical protein